MLARAKRMLIGALGRGLAAAGYEGARRAAAQDEILGWARVRARAVRRRRGVVGGVAVVVTAPGRAELLPVERLLAGAGEITVETLVSSISVGTERAQWLRLPNAQPHLPFTPGYSGVGRVLASGPGEGQLPVGTLAAVLRLPHASVATVPATWATRVPEGVRLEDAALVYLAVIAGYGIQRASLPPGEPLCVVGAGQVGALARRLAALSEPGAVTVVAASRRREEAALRIPGTAFRTGGEVHDVEAAVVIEATGDPAALSTAVAAARPGGTVVLLGSPRGLSPGSVLAEVQRKELRLVGAHISALAVEASKLGDDPFAALAGQYLGALAEGRIEVADLVGEAWDPREIGRLYRSLAAGERAAAQLDWRLLPERDRIRRRTVLAPPVLPPSRIHVPDRIRRRPVTPARPLRLAAIGCGDIGLLNARAIAAAANAELVFAYDESAALAEAVVRESGGAVARTLDAVLDPARVDAVFLSVPHDQHEPLAVKAAGAGLHILVEKPLANDLAAARRTVAAAEAGGVALSVCFPYRHEPAAMAARELVRAGALGALRGATVLFHADKPGSYWRGGFSGRSQSTWRSSRERAGGGVLIMNVTHYVDLLRHVAGLEPVRVCATSRTADGSEVEETISVAVEFAGVAIGSILASAATRGAPANRFELWGEDGTLRLEPEAAIHSERAVDGLVPGRWCTLPAGTDDDPRVLFVEQFAEALSEGRAADVTPADGLAVQSFVEAAYASVELGAWVDVELFA